MISARLTHSPAAQRELPHTPVFLRLRMLEASHGLRDVALSAESRGAALGLVADLRRAIAQTPSLTFADVVAKLETARKPADDASAGALDHEMLRSAIADLRRLPAES